MKKLLVVALVMIFCTTSFAQKISREYVSDEIAFDPLPGGGTNPNPGGGNGNQPILPSSLPSTGLMVALMSLGACAIVGIKQRKVA